MIKIKNGSDRPNWRELSPSYYVTVAIIDLYTPIDKRVLYISTSPEIFSNKHERDQYVKEMNFSSRSVNLPIFYFVDPTYDDIKKMFPNCIIKK